VSFSSRVGETKNPLKGRLGGPWRILTFCKREKTLAPDRQRSSSKKIFSLPHIVFVWTIMGMNKHYLLIKPWLNVFLFFNGSTLCSLWCTDWIFIYNADKCQFTKGWNFDNLRVCLNNRWLLKMHRLRVVE